MKIKQLVALIEKQPISLTDFHLMVLKNNLKFEQIAKFLIRLDRFRQKEKQNVRNL